MVVLAIASVALYTNPGLIGGHTVAVSVENAGPNAVFAYLDNTGRHGENTEAETLEMSGNRRTMPGLIIGAGKTRSQRASKRSTPMSDGLRVRGVDTVGPEAAALARKGPVERVGLHGHTVSTQWL